MTTTLTIEGFSFENNQCHLDWSSGMVIINQGFSTELVLRDFNFTENYSDNVGGIYITAKVSNLDKMIFNKNYAETSHAAMHFEFIESALK